MSERSHEQMSALMDGEASELELRRTLKALDDDPELISKWRRYHLARSVVQGDTRESGAGQYLRVDLAAAVSAALENEPCHEITAQKTSPNWQERFLKPLSSVAVAASVSAMVVFGWQNYPSTGETRMVSASTHGLSIAQMYGEGSINSPLQTVSDSQLQIRRNVVNQADIIRMPSEQNQRLNQYLVSHSGNAALNTASGSISYTRVVHITP